MNLIKHIYRKSFKNKLTSTINIVGLSIAFGVAISLFIYVDHEFSIDSFHSNKDRIVRVVGAKDGEVWTGPKLGESLLGKFVGIENFVRTRNNDACVIAYEGQNHLVNNNMAMDSSLFSVFDFQLVNGNEKTALRDPFSIILSEKIAHQIFGDKNPIGEVVAFNSSWDYTVTGVMKDISDNSSFKIDVLFPFHALEYQWKSSKEDPFNVLNEKFNQSFHTYLLLNKETDIAKLETNVREFVKGEYNFDSKFQFLKDIYFDSNVGDRWLRKGDKTMVFILLSIAFSLIIISLFNYINLSTALSINYLPSFSIQKSMGANYFHIAKSFILENTLYIIITLIFGFGLTLFVLPLFNNLLHTNMDIGKYYNFNVFLIVSGLTLFIILLTTSFPLWLINKKITSTQLPKKQTSYNYYNIRNILVPIQFILSIVFIAAAITIGKQMQFINNKDLGFSDENLLYVLMNTEKEINTDLFKNEVLKLSGISNLSYSAGLFGDIRRGEFTTINDRRIHFNRIYTDPEYVPTLGYNIIEGRNFSNEFQSDFAQHVFIINQAMAKECGFENPLIEKINGHPIIGVISDFHILPLQKQITPIALVCEPEQSKWVINIKLSNNNITNTLSKIEDIWKKVSPDFPLIYTFADNRIASYYQKEGQFAWLAVLFSILCAMLSCFGLIGLVLFSLQHKTKEIGIRKVNGATIGNILTMINKKFVQWVLIAIVIATPIAWYAMHKWLENFAYKTDLSWWIFALAGLLALGIALLTVSWQSWRAATRNPVEALRYE